MLEQSILPKHVAIIMDGNGRWAQSRRRPRIYGHIRGCRVVKDIVLASHDLGIKALTLFAFSTENWLRPIEEVTVLMRLLSKWLIRERKELMDLGIRVRALGSIDKLPRDVREIVLQTVEMSARNEGLELTLALSYGGREELAEVCRSVATDIQQGLVNISDINEEFLTKRLFAPMAGDPDLLIRTSGEQRISNFLLWQMAYTELYFTDVMWPDFNIGEYKKALLSYGSRQRRFGRTQEQVMAESTWK